MTLHLWALKDEPEFASQGKMGEKHPLSRVTEPGTL